MRIVYCKYSYKNLLSLLILCIFAPKKKSTSLFKQCIWLINTIQKYGEISFVQIRHQELLVEAMKDSRKVITDYNLQYKL